jgi:GMP synthase-like glutamine amidotransferase/tetratricopeptide (TPR) repeat protein
VPVHVRALALEHLHSNPVGVYGDVLGERGVDVVRVRLDEGEPLPDWRDFDLLVVMGGGMSVYQEDEHPWLADEKRLIREAVTAGTPYFGVCLGSQLLASAFGARVFKGPEPELGVNPVFLCEPARRDPIFRGFPVDLEVFEWHTDTFELPEGAVRLARSPRYENQAFRIGASAYAIQCHLETTLDDVRDWFASWPSLVDVFESRYGAGSLETFLGEYTASVASLRRTARQLFGRWLENALAELRPSGRAAFAAAGGAHRLLGRDAERAHLARVVADTHAGRSRAVLVRGEPGIGKTAFLDECAAGAAGLRVLRVVGVDTDVEAPCAGLEELCRPLLGHLDDVPAEHARALAAALRLDDRPRLGDRFAAYAGVLGLLGAAAAEQPLLVCVDDAHLVDETTLEALGFVAGRIEAEGIALVVATAGGPMPGDAAFEVVELGPLSGGASLELLDRRFGATLSPHVAAEVIAVAGGNPLALAEIPLSLTAGQRAGVEPLGDVLRTRRSAEQALLERVSSLSEPERRALLVAALATRTDLDLVSRTLRRLGLDPDTLAASESAGLVTLDAGSVAFTHGLVRSTVAYGALRTARREVHAALAQELDPAAEPEALAWHRALAAAEPDEPVAAALEDAAAGAAGRRAHAAAARAYEQAAQLTPDAAHRARRLVLAAEEAGLAGHVHAAVDHLESALAELGDPGERSRAERLLGRLLARSASAARARDVLLASAADDVDRSGAARSLTDAVIPTLRAAEPAQACRIGRRALEMAEGTDTVTEIGAAVALSTALVLSGEFVEGRRLAVRAADLAATSGALVDELQLRSYLGGALRFAGEHARAADILGAVVGESRARGSVGVLAYALVRLGAAEIDLGLWAAARGTLADAADLARETGQGADRGLASGVLAWLAAAQGREQECRQRAEEALALADRLGVGSRLDRASQALGLVELSLGRFDEAAAMLTAVRREQVAQGWSDPAIAPHLVPDLVEALALAGRVDEARTVLDEYQTEARRVGRPSSLAALARCRSLLAPDCEVEAACEEALAAGVEMTGRFDRARTELATGERLAARDGDCAARLLTSAHERFTELDAEPWAARARHGLRLLGVEEPAGAPGPLAGLGDRELQVVLAVAAGQSTRDAATSLMLTVATVEHILARALRELGLESADDLLDLVAPAPAVRA